jgi:hypothetical protein
VLAIEDLHAVLDWCTCVQQEPAPRLRRRKALPEKIPPMMSPIKSLFGRRTNAGLMLGLPGQGAAPGGLPGVCFPGAHPLLVVQP